MPGTVYFGMLGEAMVVAYPDPRCGNSQALERLVTRPAVGDGCE
jgi:hypothetical protein